MPLARLSIKSALSLAQSCITLESAGGRDSWLVRVLHGGRVEDRGPMLRGEAKVARRELRIFLALLALGFDETLSERLAKAAVAGHDTRDWRRVVAAHVERRELAGSGRGFS